MPSTALVALVSSAVAGVARSNGPGGAEPVAQEFSEWTAQHGKEYQSEAVWRRSLETYRANAATIEDLKGDAADSAEYGHTCFSDMSPADFARQRLPLKMDPAVGRRGGMPESTRAASGDTPAAVDWRTEGAITPVRDQQGCGSCWAESAVAVIESQWFLAKRPSLQALVALSVQQVVECDPHDNACYGGFPKGAYEYVIEHGGLASEESYPYRTTGHTICLANQTFNETCGDGICDDPPLTNACDETCADKAAGHASVAQISSWHALPRDEDAIAAYLARNGPVGVGIDATGGGIHKLFPWLQFYRKGVANPRSCTSTIDHGVVLVGFGEEKRRKYWIIRNSWGPKWGEAGYFRLVRGVAKCGVATMATSALVEQGQNGWFATLVV